MGLLDRFKINRKKTVLPTEVDEYYKSEMRTRRGTSILFALLALIVTLAIAAGLFFGGRAIYRALTDDNKNQTQVDENKDNSANKAQSGSSQTENSNTSEVQGPTEGFGTNESTASGSQSSNTNSGSSTSAPSTVPSTGDEPAALPHTGD